MSDVTVIIAGLTVFLCAATVYGWWWRRKALVAIAECGELSARLDEVTTERDELMAENDAIWEDWCERNGVDLAQAHWPEILQEK